VQQQQRGCMATVVFEFFEDGNKNKDKDYVFHVK
jgi:hypothetical protein